MQVWVVTVGAWDDRKIIGVAGSEAEANAMALGALRDPDLCNLAREDTWIQGPFQSGEIRK